MNNLLEQYKSLEACRAVLNELDQSRWGLNDHDKIAVLLTMAGIKPASSIGFSYMPETDSQWRAEKKKYSKKLLELLQKLNLQVIYKEKHYEEDVENQEPEQLFCIFFISNKKELIEKMADESLTSKDQEFGEMLGIPESARNAYKENSILPEDVPANIQIKAEYKLAYFLLSKDHFEDELTFLKEKVVPLVKEYLPRVFEYLTMRVSE